MLDSLRSIFSFQFKDQPMSDQAYKFLGKILHWAHDLYFRANHVGMFDEALYRAKKEKVILISNHALTVEAALIGYTLYRNQAGKMGTLVYPDAFKIPLIREFLRLAQCIPISIEAGAKNLKDRHILLFPEGMDFLSGLKGPDSMAPFHTGFLRIAQQYLKNNGRKTVCILPVAHSGVEKSLKYWVVRNKLFLDLFIRPWGNYPFWVVPKLPIFFPTRVVLNWGKPIRLKASQLDTPEKIHHLRWEFHDLIREMRKNAQEVRNGFSFQYSIPFLKPSKNGQDS